MTVVFSKRERGKPRMTKLEMEGKEALHCFLAPNYPMDTIETPKSQEAP